jgi:AraC-like DNA-binding protein
MVIFNMDLKINKFGRMAQLVRAPRSHRGDRWFDSSCAHFFKTTIYGQSVLNTSLIYFVLFIIGSIFSAACSPQKNISPVDSNCIKFETPVYGSYIKSPLCTLSISACQKVESVHLSAYFPPGNGMSDTILDLGTISQPPFKLIWAITDIPNQLFKGMGFIADAQLKNGEHLSMRQNGIFLYTRPVTIPAVSLPVSADQPKPIFIDTLPSVNMPMILNVLGNWDAQELHLTILVIDQAFSLALPKEKLSELGVQLYIDPFVTKSAYPTEKTLVVSYPLMNKSIRYIYKKNTSETEAISFSIDSCEFAYPATIKTAEGKGYGLDIGIPKKIFGQEMPESLACNILIKVLDRYGQINAISINRQGSNVALCPILWSTMLREKTDYLSNPLYIFLACFGLGFCLVIFVTIILVAKKRKVISLTSLNLSEDDKRQAKAVFGFIDQNITKDNLTIAEAAGNLDISGSKIESIIKKYTGLSFKNYCVKSMVEIAKERLRSSHASESSIAESCGFKNIDAMEKQFVKYCRTTPYKYRRDNQVA